MWRLAPLALTGVVTALFFALDPRPFDLAAHVYRTHLFETEGFTLWNGQWYGGHHTPAYSVLFPPLAALFGPLVVGVVSCFVSALLFDALARGRWGDQARWGSLWFAAGIGVILFTGRLPFGMGVALGLASLLAFQRGRRRLAALLAVLCSLASPVSGAFLALAAFAYAISGEHGPLSARGFRLRGLPTSPGDVRLRLRGSQDEERRPLRERLPDWGIRPAGLVLFAAALVPPLLLTFTFPEGGYQPFRGALFLGAPICALAFVVFLPERERALRVGVLLYAIAVVAAKVIDTPMGSNAVRLGALFAGPVLACAVLSRRHVRTRWQVAAVTLALLAGAYWQVSTPFRDAQNALADPGAESSYYDPLLDWLEDNDDGPPWRLHIPFTRSHFEAASVASHYPLARGWERQVDTRNRIFYDGYLTPLTYAAWLSEHGVKYVALPSVRPDFSSQTERGLIERGLPYLKLRWQSEDWRVYEFMLPHPLAVPEDGSEMTVTKLEPDEVELDVRRPGEAILRVRWSPYWKAHGGCVERDGDWTRVTANEPGRLRVTMTFGLDRVIERGRRCAD